MIPVTESFSDRIHHQLKTALMNGEFVPGQKLSMRGLAANFGTSPMPVRDALRRLVAEGALGMSSSRAFVVPALSTDELIKLRELRKSLEGLAAFQATGLITGFRIERLEALEEEMLERLQTRDHRGYLERHRSFHFTIYASVDFPMVGDFIEAIWARLGPRFRQTLETSDLTGSIGPYHQEIIAALKAQDPDSVRRAIELDIISAANTWTAQSYPGAASSSAGLGAAGQDFEPIPRPPRDRVS